jgi:hypothetical protein
MATPTSCPSLNSTSASTTNSKSSSEEQKSVEASYKVVSGKVAVSKQRSRKSNRSFARVDMTRPIELANLVRVSKVDYRGKGVMQACLDKEHVRIVGASYSGKTLAFTVRNGNEEPRTHSRLRRNSQRHG